jgi:methanogenic corrinoid protein MtbC1
VKDVLTPKQIARAIQVSESSVKRWCDKGLIPARYTAGGHRRIDMSVLLEFLRSSKYELVRPEVLGLPATTGQTERVIQRAADQLEQAIVRGDEEQCRRITFDLFLAEHSISAICDQVFAEAFESIGDRWECGDAEVYQERRACEIALRVLHELRAFLPAVPADAPQAIGGAPEGDQYNLATTMAELVLKDAKWNAVSLGDNLPFETLAAAIQEHRPRLFWLSCSHISDPTAFLEGYNKLYDELGLDVAIVVGGRALNEGLRERMKYAAYCDTMQHLDSFAQSLIGASGK